MMMSIALRFIPTLIEETDKIMNAQKARGAQLDNGKMTERIKALVPVLVPLFISAFRRADELAMAMECRCYHGGEGRTRLKQLKFTSEDFRCMVVIIVALVIIACTRFSCRGWHKVLPRSVGADSISACPSAATLRAHMECAPTISGDL